MVRRKSVQFCWTKSEHWKVGIKRNKISPSNVYKFLKVSEIRNLIIILGGIKYESNVSPVTRTVEHDLNILPSTISSRASVIVVRPNDFAIISVPAMKGHPKDYIGMVIETNAQLGFLISFLKRTYDKFFFPETADLSWVNVNEIVEVLKTPVKNKKDQFVFPELKEKLFKVWWYCF